MERKKMKKTRNKKGRSLLITIVVLSVILILMPVIAVGEITAARDISKQTVAPGKTFTVTVTITATQTIYAPILDEDLPTNWTVTPLQNDGATFKESEIKWLWMESLSEGDSRTVVYNVTVPSDAESGLYYITGGISAYQIPCIDVDGESKINVSWPCGNMNVNPTSWSPPTINCGDSDSQIVTVSATGGVVEGVTVSKISGETWLTLSQTNLGDIPSGSSKTFTMTAAPPAGTSSGDYPYTVRVSNTCGTPSSRDVTGTIHVIPSETVVSIEDASAPQGGTVTVPINITGVANMCGASIWLNYEKDVVIVDSVLDGDLVPLTYSIDNTAGVTKMTWDTTSGMTGDFVFAYVTLKAVGNSGDGCWMELDVKELYDCDLVEIPRAVADGIFEVIPPPLMEGDVTDLNVCVSLKDSTLIKFYLVDMATLTPDQLECADTNDDGEVTLKDSTAIKFWLVDQYPLWESPADDHMMKPVPCSVVSLARNDTSTTDSIEDTSVPAKCSPLFVADSEPIEKKKACSCYPQKEMIGGQEKLGGNMK